jgi:hypothetical protein
MALPSGCATVKTNPGPLVYASPTTLDTTVSLSPQTEQTAKVQVNVEYQTFEVRLSEPPACSASAHEQVEGFRRIEKHLDQKDQIIKWSGYGAAAVTVLDVIIGMARGQSVGRGFAILGIWGVPFAAVGVAESYREMDTTEPVPAVERTRRIANVPCPREINDLEVDVYVGTEVAPRMRLNTQWQRVDVPYTGSVTSGTYFVPLVVGQDRLAAFLLGERASDDLNGPPPEHAVPATSPTAPGKDTGATLRPLPQFKTTNPLAVLRKESL